MSGKPTFWRSLEELEPGAIEALLEAEFPALHEIGRISRRDLMRLMGASMALAGIAGCRAPSAAPAPSAGGDGGEPAYTATTLELDGYGRGARVRSQDGRPVKIEGNPHHPASLGRTDPIMQAEVLALYDPDRSRAPWRDGRTRSWAELRRWLIQQRRALAADEGTGTHVLIGATSSPTAAALVDRLRERLPALRFHTYSPVSDPFEPERVYDLTAADAVLSLAGDFLGPGPAQVRYAYDWSARKLLGGPPLLIVAEPSPTLTGAQADRRLALAPHRIDELARSLIGGGSVEIASVLQAAPRPLVVADAGRAALADRLNASLGADAARRIAPVRLGAASGAEPIGALFADMAAGRVRRLVVIDCNPAYDAPAAGEFTQLLARVPESLHLGLSRDETARACRWHVPQRHVLESWGDLRAFDGTVGLQQPATTPLLRGLSPIELLALLAGEPADGKSLVRRHWSALDDGAWAAALETGVVPGTEAEPIAAEPRLPPLPPRRRGEAPRFALVFRPDARLWDGRHANNAWLQELPDPLTKLVWGNAAWLAPVDAGRLALARGDLVEIRCGNAVIAAPVFIMPGQAPGAVTLTLGYGRRHAGRVGSDLGVNVSPLRGQAGRVSLRKLPGRGRLIETGRRQRILEPEPVRTVAPGESAGASRPAADRGYAYPEKAWAMVVDLDACIGCGACTIACQAENNIPVVGPDEAGEGREMHWIRVDRYFEGGAAEPLIHFQPVPCMHCEKAPCETVCPVAATVHSSDGLNQMVYNRCIGTRTCSNNCPYKVRRFNWYDYQERAPATPPAAHNPDVLVRGRGVMEKCTYCVHRIQGARAQATAEGRELAGDEVRTACQQACPANAILFGDLNDPHSSVSRARRSGRNYALLDHLGTRPRTTYLAKARRR